MGPRPTANTGTPDARDAHRKMLLGEMALVAETNTPRITIPTVCVSAMVEPMDIMARRVPL